MKGIILASGSGTRLYSLTKVMSKQLLPQFIMHYAIEKPRLITNWTGYWTRSLQMEFRRPYSGIWTTVSGGDHHQRRITELL